jgi:hypothetical protein
VFTGERPNGALTGGGITLILILEREDLVCPFCREAFKALCDTLCRYRHLLDIHCIVNIDPSDLPSTMKNDEAMRIIKDQVSGLLKGLGADFVLYLDMHAVFDHSEDPPSLIMLNHPFQLVRKWNMPLPHQEMNELCFFIHATGDKP